VIPGAALALAATLVVAADAAPARQVALDVPVIPQARERCGPAALRMVMRFHHAGAAAEREAETAYDPVLRGALITDLAAAARRAGFDASVATPGWDSLAALMQDGVPPILLVDSGVGPLRKGHYVVLTAWNEPPGKAVIHDGGRRPRTLDLGRLRSRWRLAGEQALLVRPR
jgi:hypothetical protein